ncbi:hypothetical protein [Cetobacterium somerae]|uniref:hypothetical protein n=1 Tax=Cetobacterium somerae TaxID=188913 RepID=UPI00248F0F6A|nr:hypothetical protein [Cetobacterium somerae]
MEYKFLIVVRDGFIEKDGELYQVILAKEKSTSLKEIKRYQRKFEKEYPQKEIIFKECIKGKWKEIVI